MNNLEFIKKVINQDKHCGDCKGFGKRCSLSPYNQKLNKWDKERWGCRYFEEVQG